MANSIGEFELNHSGNVYAKNDDGVVVAYVTYEGNASGFGTVMGTLAFPLPEGGGLVPVHAPGQLRHSRRTAHGPPVTEKARGNR